jgi:hypothetical protein
VQRLSSFDVVTLQRFDPKNFRQVRFNFYFRLNFAWFAKRLIHKRQLDERILETVAFFVVAAAARVEARGCRQFKKPKNNPMQSTVAKH